MSRGWREALIDGKSLSDAWATSDDVEKSKPEADFVAAALAQVEGASGVMVGDSVYDARVAAMHNIPALGVRTGEASCVLC
ncbi:HAD hydrolase-like protein [Intrasporangium calvum]|uniref:HAD hydrolase-like protein n=1 Tax=Intrasporangium calvum TaxID=53358 RepID=A0ABT5GF46_9MICO|nr:HAD hydrolase-like protein [Intrasporangium calvum]MDC5696869.1 HAD hydrolase-like protein [Intrasporangium calvum]